MNLAKGLERRLERLFENTPGRVFGGRLHPSELAGRLAREADLARFRHDAGPATANRYTIRIGPREGDLDFSVLQEEMQGVLADFAIEEGLRLEGPPIVKVEIDPEISPGQMKVDHAVVEGPLEPWARLIGETAHEVGNNRAIVGRGAEADVAVAHDDISRRHALLFRKASRTWLQDLQSANGTYVEGKRVGKRPKPITHGMMIRLASHEFRFLET